jgi:hypothetical protein
MVFPWFFHCFSMVFPWFSHEKFHLSYGLFQPGPGPGSSLVSSRSSVVNTTPSSCGFGKESPGGVQKMGDELSFILHNYPSN